MKSEVLKSRKRKEKDSNVRRTKNVIKLCKYYVETFLSSVNLFMSRIMYYAETLYLKYDLLSTVLLQTGIV